MNYVVKDKNPESLFRFFEEICAIPHGSGNEKAIADYLCNFARTGNPNHMGKLPVWIASDKSQPRVMRLGGKSTRMGKPAAVKLIYTMLTTKPVGE